MDVHLTDFGRKQAFVLNPFLYEEFSSHYDKVHCSDLKRSFDTAYYALAFPSEEDLIFRSRLLRELNFGAHEGLHYDNLPQEEKLRF